jgi:signal transduction histidine kinase
MSRLLIKKDRKLAREKVIHTREIVGDSFLELKKSLSGNLTTKINVYKLIEEIEKMAKEIEAFGTRVEVISRHSGESIEPKCYDAIYRMCQEGLTNAVRHGQAKTITVGIRFNETGLDLVIADDGKGCINLIKGNGLLGMEQRVKELKGSLSCGSPDGEGFNIHIKIPRQKDELLCS